MSKAKPMDLSRAIPGHPGYTITRNGRVRNETLDHDLLARLNYRTGEIFYWFYDHGVPVQITREALLKNTFPEDERNLSIVE